METLKFDNRRTRIKYCPCGRSNRDGKFAPYKGYEDKGYCHSCGNTFLPEMDAVPVKIEKPKPKPIVYFPENIYQRTLKNWKQTDFIQNLIKNIDEDALQKVAELYRIGGISKGTWKGGICFPFIDANDKIRSIQVKKFDAENHTSKTGKLDKIILNALKKSNSPQPQWLRNYLDNDSFYTCNFGDHLLNSYPKNPIAIVEAPKTAIIAALYFGTPDNEDKPLFIATGSLHYFQPKKCQPMAGRKIKLYPDLHKEGKAFDIWKFQAKQLQKQLIDSEISISTLLEQHATDQQRIDGCDLADFLFKYDWKQFTSKAATPPPPIDRKLLKAYSQYLQKLHFEDGLLMADQHPASWDLTDDIPSEIKQIIETATPHKVKQLKDIF